MKQKDITIENIIFTGEYETTEPDYMVGYPGENFITGLYHGSTDFYAFFDYANMLNEVYELIK